MKYLFTPAKAYSWAFAQCLNFQRKFVLAAGFTEADQYAWEYLTQDGLGRYVGEDAQVAQKSRKLTAPEEQKLQTALQTLRDYVQHTPVRFAINLPEFWLLYTEPCLDRYAFALCDFAFLTPAALSSSYLPAVLAHLLGWYNHPLWLSPPYCYISLLRQMSASFQLQALPVYGCYGADKKGKPDGLVRLCKHTKRDWKSTTLIYPYAPALGSAADRVHTTSDGTITAGDPEWLRPEPVDVVMGGGHNYADFGWKAGIKAAAQYIGTLPNNPEMTEYFHTTPKWAQFLKFSQEHADAYAHVVFGQGEALIELLKRYVKRYKAPNEQTIHFYLPPAYRIQKLQREGRYIKNLRRLCRA